MLLAECLPDLLDCSSFRLQFCNLLLQSLELLDQGIECAREPRSSWRRPTPGASLCCACLSRTCLLGLAARRSPESLGSRCRSSCRLCCQRALILASLGSSRSPLDLSSGFRASRRGTFSSSHGLPPYSLWTRIRDLLLHRTKTAEMTGKRRRETGGGRKKTITKNNNYRRRNL